MDSWINELKRACADELGTRQPIATLATVQGTEARPRADARSIVIRRITESGDLLITSDSRSEKNAQLKSNSSASVVFWFARLKMQFIVDGTVEIHGAGSTDARRSEIWAELSDATRASFFWPTAGQPFDSDAKFQESAFKQTAMPDAFEVLVLTPVAVDTLDLNPHPHGRVKWKKPSVEWACIAVNP